MSVEQTDWDAAKSYQCTLSPTPSLAQAFAAHRIAAEQRGREAERAEVVASIRATMCDCSGKFIADAIEARSNETT